MNNQKKEKENKTEIKQKDWKLFKRANKDIKKLKQH